MWFLDILSDRCACHHVALRRNPWLLKVRYETHAWRHITEFGGREQSRSTTRNKLKIRYTTNPGVLVYSPMLRAWHNNMHSGKRVLRVQSQHSEAVKHPRCVSFCHACNTSDLWSKHFCPDPRVLDVPTCSVNTLFCVYTSVVVSLWKTKTDCVLPSFLSLEVWV